jgi:hypothetical protein
MIIRDKNRPVMLNKEFLLDHKICLEAKGFVAIIKACENEISFEDLKPELELEKLSYILAELQLHGYMKFDEKTNKYAISDEKVDIENLEF